MSKYRPLIALIVQKRPNIKSALVACGCLVIFGLVFNPVYADRPAPDRDYAIKTTDGQFMLVMRTGGRATIDALKAYKRSGLYPIDQPENPVWTVDWYSKRVYTSENGDLLVRMGPWASHTYDLALAFYRAGQLQHEYRIHDLIEDEEKLQYTISHFFWLESVEWHEDSHVIALVTVDGIVYTFDAATGLLIDAVR